MEEYDKAIDVLYEATNLIPNYSPEMMILKKKDRKKLTEFGTKFRIPYFLGYAFMQKKNYEKALHYFRVVLDIKPHYKRAWNHIGKIYHIKGEFREAINALNKSLNITPEQLLNIHFVKPQVLFRALNVNMQDFKQSSQYLQLIKENDSSNFDAWVNLTEIYFDLKEFDKALQSCEESLKIDPESIKALKLKDRIQNLLKG